jgi:hypothetical protein
MERETRNRKQLVPVRWNLSNEKGMMSYLYKYRAPKNTSHINAAPHSKSNTLE